MSLSVQKITQSDILTERVRSVPVAGAALRLLRDANVVCLGIDERPRHWRWGDGHTATTLLFWVTRGCMAWGEAPGSVRARAGEVLILPPSCVRHLVTEDEPLRALWLHLAGTPLSGAGPSVLKSRVTDMLDPVVEGMLAESLRNDAGSRDACRLLAGLYLHYVRRELGVDVDPAQREIHERLSQLWAAVHADLAGDWSLERMAARLHVSVGHSHRLVAQHYGTTPRGMLRKLRLERAAELLLSSNATLDHIAEQVGYGSAYAFSRAFLSRFGCRPGAYRRTGDVGPGRK